MDAEGIRRRLDAAPMGRTQVAAVATIVALSALDGYDVLSVTFAAPAIVQAWGIGKVALGAVLSAGLVGMALGSLLLAPLADIVGRRPLVMFGLVLMALGMSLSATAHSLALLSTSRVVTGLGIGVMVAVINPMAAEFANARRRPLALSLMAMGYPLGGLIGGLLASVLLHAYGWQAVFIAGGVGALLMFPVVLYFLPESLGFLLTRQDPKSLGRINALLVAVGQPPVDSLSGSTGRKSGYAAIFARAQRATTLRIMAANLLYVLAVYYILSWLPQMVVDAGFPPAKASLVAATANLVGLGGGLTLGMLATRAGLQRTTVVMMVGLGVSVAVFAATPHSLPMLVVAAAMCGFFLFGGISGIYATLAISFADAARASASGFVIGVGRIGSAVAPLLAGWLLANGFDNGDVSLVFGAMAMLGGLCLALGRPRDFLGSETMPAATS